MQLSPGAAPRALGPSGRPYATLVPPGAPSAPSVLPGAALPHLWSFLAPPSVGSKTLLSHTKSSSCEIWTEEENKKENSPCPDLVLKNGNADLL